MSRRNLRPKISAQNTGHDNDNGCQGGNASGQLGNFHGDRRRRRFWRKRNGNIQCRSTILCDKKSRGSSHDTSGQLAGQNGQGLFAYLFDLLVKRYSQCHNSRFQQEFDIFPPFVIRFIRYIADFQYEDNQNDRY